MNDVNYFQGLANVMSKWKLATEILYLLLLREKKLPNTLPRVCL